MLSPHSLSCLHGTQVDLAHHSACRIRYWPTNNPSFLQFSISVFSALALVSCTFSWFQPPVGVPGSQPLLPNSMDPTRPQGTALRHRVLQRAVFGEICYGRTPIAQAFVKWLCFISPIRTSKHGRPDENEPTQRNGRHGPTGWLTLLSIKQLCLDCIGDNHRKSNIKWV